MEEDVLEDIGLTPAQSRVYLSLTGLKEAKSGDIIKKSGLQSSVVYNALTQLIEKGLVSFVLRGKVKYFIAAHPDSLLDLIEKKRERVERIIPALIKKRLTTPKHEAQVFLGWKGMFFAFNKILEILPKGSDYIAFGAGFESQYTEEAKRFFRNYQKKRHLMKYKTKVIVNEKSRKQTQEYGWNPKFGKPKYKYVPGYAPIGVIIFGDNILHAAFGEVPIAVMISSKEIADSFRKMFYSMWKHASH